MYLFSKLKTRRCGALAGRRELSSQLVLDTPTSVRFLAGSSFPDHAGCHLSSPRTFPGARGPHGSLCSRPSCAKACGRARVPSSPGSQRFSFQSWDHTTWRPSAGNSSAGGWVDAAKSYERAFWAMPLVPSASCLLIFKSMCISREI